MMRTISETEFYTIPTYPCTLKMCETGRVEILQTTYLLFFFSRDISSHGTV